MERLFILDDSKIGTYAFNEIDRVDNSKGYITSNVVPCCKFCNAAKGTSTVTEFMYWLTHINPKKENA